MSWLVCRSETRLVCGARPIESACWNLHLESGHRLPSARKFYVARVPNKDRFILEYDVYRLVVRQILTFDEVQMIG